MVKSDKNMQKIGERKEKKRSHRNLICLIFLATLHTNDHDQWFGCMWRRRRPFLLIVRTILHPRSRPDLQNGLKGFNYRQPPFLWPRPTALHYAIHAKCICLFVFEKVFAPTATHFAKHAWERSNTFFGRILISQSIGRVFIRSSLFRGSGTDRIQWENFHSMESTTSKLFPTPTAWLTHTQSLSFHPQSDQSWGWDPGPWYFATLNTLLWCNLLQYLICQHRSTEAEWSVCLKYRQ